MDRLNALRGTPSPSARAVAHHAKGRRRGERLLRGAGAAPQHHEPAARAGGAAAPVEKTPARASSRCRARRPPRRTTRRPRTSSRRFPGPQPTPAATPAARPAPPPTPMSISPPPPPPSQQQRRVSFREPVDAPPPPLPRTVSDDAETPPKETDDVLKLVDSWGADASPDDEAKRLAQLRADEERRRASEAQAESARTVALEEAVARAEAEVSGLRRISSNSPEEGSRLTERRRARREATVWSAGGSSSSDADAATTPAPTAPKRTDSAEARDFFAALGAPVAAEPEAATLPEPAAAPVEPEAFGPRPAPARRRPRCRCCPRRPWQRLDAKERTPDGARVVTTCSEGSRARRRPSSTESRAPSRCPAWPLLRSHCSRPRPASCLLPTRVDSSHAGGRRRRAAARAAMARPARGTRAARPADAGRRATGRRYNDDGAPQRRDVRGAAPAARVPAAASPNPRPRRRRRRTSSAGAPRRARPRRCRRRAQPRQGRPPPRGGAWRPQHRPRRRRPSASSLTAPVAPKFAERKADPSACLPKNAAARGGEKARAAGAPASNARAVPGAAGRRGGQLERPRRPGASPRSPSRLPP